MCDTYGKIGLNGELSIFGKNSDRQLREPQILVSIPEKIHKKKKLKATYIEIDQVEKTHAIFISKPSWTWGAEMGVNDCGVCIGNEATPLNGKKNDEALIGMDLVRLGLERSNSAKMALDVIIGLLEKYGQGGNCGFETPYFYNNSYIIMDFNEMYVLETKGKEWAFKKMSKGNISNDNTLKSADAHSPEYDFKKKFKLVSGARTRKRLVGKHLRRIKTKVDAFKGLRAHSACSSSPCMHGLNYKTTSSMVVFLKKDEKPEIWVTGCSSPCVSIFKPYVFGEKIYAPICSEDSQSDEYWNKQESISKHLLAKKHSKKFNAERDEIEQELMNAIESDKTSTFEKSLEMEKQFFAKWTSKKGV